jgi:hypothetical protein
MKDQRHLLCLALFALNLSRCDRPGASAVPLTSRPVPPILLFNGTGTSPNDVAAIETVLEKSRISYSTANSAQLDEMRARLRTYHLIIFPGGDFTRMGIGLRKETAAKLRDAVQYGVNYLGICAGYPETAQPRALLLHSLQQSHHSPRAAPDVERRQGHRGSGRKTLAHEGNRRERQLA